MALDEPVCASRFQKWWVAGDARVLDVCWMLLKAGRCEIFALMGYVVNWRILVLWG